MFEEIFSCNTLASISFLSMVSLPKYYVFSFKISGGPWWLAGGRAPLAPPLWLRAWFLAVYTEHSQHRSTWICFVTRAVKSGVSVCRDISLGRSVFHDWQTGAAVLWCHNSNFVKGLIIQLKVNRPGLISHSLQPLRMHTCNYSNSSRGHEALVLDIQQNNKYSPLQPPSLHEMYSSLCPVLYGAALLRPDAYGKRNRNLLPIVDITHSN